MRAKIASHAGGHAFEERFLKLDPIQQIILYSHAVKEENDKKQEVVDVLQTVFKKFDNLFESIQFFTNPELFKRKLELEKVKNLRNEVTEDNFETMWEQTLSIIPNEYIIEEPDVLEDFLENQNPDPEFDDLMTGWIQNRRDV
jgi:hypothetical protein